MCVLAFAADFVSFLLCIPAWLLPAGALLTKGLCVLLKQKGVTSVGHLFAEQSMHVVIATLTECMVLVEINVQDLDRQLGIAVYNDVRHLAGERAMVVLQIWLGCS